MSIYTFQVKTNSGSEISLAEYRNHVLLVVNVASKCGFTSQYEGLESLFQKYQNQRFSVLGFPCNQFGSQEPGSDAEIKQFCDLNYHVTFPIFSKIMVNGPEAHPLYQYLKDQKKGFLGTKAIKWNFTKFLVDRTGKVIQRYAPKEAPEDIRKDIEKLL
jgi:glutathione peroxidase